MHRDMHKDVGRCIEFHEGERGGVAPTGAYVMHKDM